MSRLFTYILSDTTSEKTTVSLVPYTWYRSNKRGSKCETKSKDKKRYIDQEEKQKGQLKRLHYHPWSCRLNLCKLASLAGISVGQNRTHTKARSITPSNMGSYTVKAELHSTTLKNSSKSKVLLMYIINEISLWAVYLKPQNQRETKNRETWRCDLRW